MRARLVVVGLGRIGRLHAANLAGRVPRAELVGVVDPLERVAREVAERLRVPFWTSLDRLPAKLGADGVVIAAPTALHPGLAAAAARAGLDVLCEKPLGFDAETAQRAVDAAHAEGVQLQVAFQRRFDPDWVGLAKSDVGEPRLLRVSHRNAHEPPSSSPLGDIFVDMAVHDLDAARWLCGEVAELFAAERSGVVTISLRFESGALGLIDVSRTAAYGFECSAELVGSRATVRSGTAWRPLGIELLCDGRASAPLAADHAERHASAYVAELDQFADVVLGAAPRGATGEDALAALRLALLARRSAAVGTPQSPPSSLAVA
jgi:predicted dehydrogenase